MLTQTAPSSRMHLQGERGASEGSADPDDEGPTLASFLVLDFGAYLQWGAFDHGLLHASFDRCEHETLATSLIQERSSGS